MALTAVLLLLSGLLVPQQPAPGQVPPTQSAGSAELTLGLAALNAKPEDDDAALHHFQEAAQAGNHEGELQLGALYAEGKGVPKDAALANKWFLLAAQGGSALAQYDLAIRYAYGRGVPADNAQAFHWFEQAAKQGFAPAEMAIATGYEQALGVPQSDANALIWYRKAAARGDPVAQFQSALLLLASPQIPRDVTAIVKYVKPAAEQGVADAAAVLGSSYSKGEGVPEDRIAAYKWLLIAQRLGAKGVDPATLKQFGTSLKPEEAAAATRQAAAWQPVLSTANSRRP